jgi:hypothetical protein
MYSVSKEMPLESYQVIQPADNQTDFTPGQVIRFNIPRSTGFWDSHLSKIQFNVKTTGANYKMCFNSPYAGVACLIDMVRVSQNGKVISEVLDYAQLQHFIKGYELSLSGLQREAVQKGLVDYHITDSTGYKALSNDCLVGQGIHRSGAISAAGMQQDVKFQLSLDFISLFEILEIVPSVVLGDLMVEIRVSPTKEQILKVLPATGVVHATSAMPVAGQPMVVTLTPPFQGFTCLADSPFIVGQSVISNIAGVDGVTNYPITALAEANSTGVITITSTLPVVSAADAGQTAIKISLGADGNAAVSLTQFLVTKSELQLQVVKPPTQYVMDIVQEAEAGQMFIDVDTYTSYRSTILSGIKSQNITIPTTQSRVKSFFTVPRLGNQTGTFSTNNSTDWNYDGVYGGLRNYRSQIDGIYYPNTPIELSVMLGGWHYSGEHLRELQKAFDASGLPMRSLLGLKQNFVVARALSAYGSSTNLTGTPINLYLEYNGNGPTSTSIPNATIALTTAGTAYTTVASPNSVATTGGTGSGLTVTLTANAAAPFAITAVALASQGTGYTNGDILNIVSGGAIFDAITAGGTTYAGAAGVATTGGTGAGCIITTTDNAGVVDSVTITTPGTGYTNGDTLTITGGDGAATFTITVTSDGQITLTKSAFGLDAISFVHHTNRISVSPMGIDVMN